MKKLFLLSYIFLFTATLTFSQTKWTLDKSHSKVQFSVSHLVITDVVGQFKNYDVKVETNGDDFTNAKIEFTADVNSIDTDNEGRDKHLKSDDFFNAEKFPQIKFVGKKMEKVGDGKFKLTGDFTIRDVTKTITLDVSFRGIVKDPWGNTKAGFKVKGMVNRFDYNLKWNNLMETGGAVVGKDVELLVDLQLKKQK
ncbi:MAG: YceI family protein [Melioribacteraceae bacterium]|nr:YceI family protein [Melioribacteraceae bacterium]